MKNILNTLSNGGLGALGDKLGTMGGPGGLSSVGNALKGTLQNANSGVNLNGIGGMLGSAAIGGLLGALFGGKGAGKLAENVLVAGGTVAAGALAWKFYQKWSQQSQTQVESAAPVPPTPGGWSSTLQQQEQPAALPPAENTAMLLLEAIVFAARADGHIDADERVHIQNAVQSLFNGQEMPALIEQLLDKPVDPVALAARVRTPEEGRDLYRLSCAVIAVDSFMERSYLDGLGQALGISATERAQLEDEAQAARA